MHGLVWQPLTLSGSHIDGSCLMAERLVTSQHTSETHVPTLQSLRCCVQALNEREAQPGVQWGCARLIDSGPILRLDAAGKQLSKQQRYGHPTDRPVLSSSIPADKFLQIVVSFFEHGLRGLEPRAGGWQTWGDLHAVNAAIDWQAWRIPDAL